MRAKRFEYKFQIPVAFKKGEFREASLDTQIVLINAAISFTGSKDGASRMLGIDRGTLYNALRKYKKLKTLITT